MRIRFDEQLEQLNEEMINMGNMIEASIGNAVKALMKQDEELAKKTMAGDEKIDRTERKIEDLCLRLLLQQQPVARDLRNISSALKMVTDMERIGDHATDISELAIVLSEKTYVKKLDHIEEMARETMVMLIQSLEAYVEKDLDKAQKVIAHDDVIDDLSLSYAGNRLKKVADRSGTSAFNNGFEFKDGIDLSTEYEYDENGNLTKDLNKKKTAIQYNCLNLPSRVMFANGNSISYLYDAAGRKLRTVHFLEGDSVTTDYCGNVVYENGVPQILLTEVGYVSLTDGQYHYYLKDHQGNNRVVVDEEGTVEEVNHYYPFGGVFSSTGDAQPYKYNGKELDRKGGLDWYDYGARYYDAALGRWHVVDPMADKDYSWSVYVYCQNNTIKYIDPDGKQVIPVPMPYAPLPFYSPITYPQSYNLPSDQQIMRYASGKFAEV